MREDRCAKKGGHRVVQPSMIGFSSVKLPYTKRWVSAVARNSMLRVGLINC
jgi:hypothetical protein